MLNTRLASGQYAACGFQIYLQRKHQPMIYQVFFVNSILLIIIISDNITIINMI